MDGTKDGRREDVRSSCVKNAWAMWLYAYVGASCLVRRREARVSRGGDGQWG
jgi:hypothetical protein